jgi:dephospho-CoA kinase
MTRTAKIYGLTGGIASGKTTVSDTLAQQHVQIVDTDVIARSLTEPDGAAIAALRAEFGEHMIAANGAMDRTAMRDLVFRDPAARKRLEGILHPLIHQQCEERLAAPVSGAPYHLVVVPLMAPGSVWLQRCERIIVVDCTVEQQLERLMKRSQLDPVQARAIIDAQASREQRLSFATDVIHNLGDRASLIADALSLHERLLALIPYI